MREPSGARLEFNRVAHSAGPIHLAVVDVLWCIIQTNKETKKCPDPNTSENAIAMFVYDRTDKQTNKPTRKQTNKHTHQQTDKQTQTIKQANEQTNKCSDSNTSENAMLGNTVFQREERSPFVFCCMRWHSGNHSIVEYGMVYYSIV